MRQMVRHILLLRVGKTPNFVALDLLARQEREALQAEAARRDDVVPISALTGFGLDLLGQRISNQSSFDPRNYGYAKLSKLLEATDLFDIRDAGGPNMAVRDRRGAAATSTNGTGGGNA